MSRSVSSSTTGKKKNQADINLEEGSFPDDLSTLLLASPENDNSSPESSNAAAVAQTVLKELTCGAELWVDPLTVHPVVTDDAPTSLSVPSSPSNSSISHISLLEDKDAMRTWLQTSPTFLIKEDVAAVNDFNSPSTVATAATETVTGTESSCDWTETDNAATSSLLNNHICNNRNSETFEISWDANTLPNPQNDYTNNKDLALQLHKQKQQKDTAATSTGGIGTAQSSSTNFSALGWIYNFFFTQCASGGTDLGLCSPTISTHVTKPLSKTEKQSNHNQNQQQEIESTSTLGRAETTSSEKLGIIAPPVILRRPTDPTFIPHAVSLRSEKVAKPPN